MPGLWWSDLHLTLGRLPNLKWGLLHQMSGRSAQLYTGITSLRRLPAMQLPAWGCEREAVSWLEGPSEALTYPVNFFVLLHCSI